MDLIGTALNFLGSLDLIGTIANEVQGYTKLEYSGSYDGALAHKIKLERQGIPCRIEGGNWLTNACVYTREEEIGG